MDAKQIAERHVIERYLANQLSEAEAGRFEAYVEAHPEVVQDIELVARMKSSLATLDRRGELAPLLRAPARTWYRQPAALAASIVAAIVAAVLFMNFRGSAPSQTLLAATVRELAGPSEPAMRIASRLLLTRERGSPGNALANPGSADAATEILIEVRQPGTRSEYEITLWRIAGSALQLLGESKGIRADTAGLIHCFVRTGALGSGNYVVRVSADDGAPPAEYSLHITE